MSSDYLSYWVLVYSRRIVWAAARSVSGIDRRPSRLSVHMVRSWRWRRTFVHFWRLAGGWPRAFSSSTVVAAICAHRWWLITKLLVGHVTARLVIYPTPSIATPTIARILFIDYAEAAYKDWHTKHDKSSETYTDTIKKTLKTYTTDAANVCHMDFLIEETEFSNRLIPYLVATDRISCWQSLAIVFIKILPCCFNFW